MTGQLLRTGYAVAAQDETPRAALAAQPATRAAGPAKSRTLAPEEGRTSARDSRSGALGVRGEGVRRSAHGRDRIARASLQRHHLSLLREQGGGVPGPRPSNAGQARCGFGGPRPRPQRTGGPLAPRIAAAARAFH